MNKLIAVVMMFLALVAMTPVNAADTSSSGDKSAQAQQPKAPDVAEFDKQMAQAQENMKKMYEQMDKIQQTKDPKERQKLVEEHWASMQNGMGMMQGMWNTCMTGQPMMSG